MEFCLLAQRETLITKMSPAPEHPAEVERLPDREIASREYHPATGSSHFVQVAEKGANWMLPFQTGKPDGHPDDHPERAHRRTDPNVPVRCSSVIMHACPSRVTPGIQPSAAW
jgi:hypothetical protein